MLIVVSNSLDSPSGIVMFHVLFILTFRSVLIFPVFSIKTATLNGLTPTTSGAITLTFILGGSTLMESVIFTPFTVPSNVHEVFELVVVAKS